MHKKIRTKPISDVEKKQRIKKAIADERRKKIEAKQTYNDIEKHKSGLKTGERVIMLHHH